MRLTLFYAGLFLLLGTILLAIVYLLTSRGGAISVAVPSPVVRRQLKLPDGLVITVPAPTAVRRRTSSPSSTTPTSPAC